MSVTIGGVTIPIPQNEQFEPVPIVNETVLFNGKTSIQASTEYGKRWTFSCIGTSTQYDALLAKIGTSTNFVLNGSSYSYCYIKSIVPIVKNPMTSYYSFNLAIVQDTSIST